MHLRHKLLPQQCLPCQLAIEVGLFFLEPRAHMLPVEELI